MCVNVMTSLHYPQMMLAVSTQILQIKITSPGFQANLFRFRLLCVRDVNSTSRLQLGSIDLYRIHHL
ncbi:unnamed protein product [Brassica rapa]|uniref:Uncharacterized protein n=1 Tax=Brassica campestris TaxID=3711 RepID=A0A3P5XUD5_BRACM|nr:unnamed protein product [Brassica rapa]VDC58517.1 unnamed protein product [Brassica rapa]